MQIIPWRVQKVISEHFPLLYHLIASRGGRANSQEHWDIRLAATWDEPGRNWPERVEAIAQLLPFHASIIDVGCGTGSILRGLRERGFADLNGLELSEYAVNRLSSSGFRMSKGTLLNIPFPDATFDAAIASEVLEHVIRRTRFLREMTRIVKPRGKILIFVPDDNLGPIDEPEHVIKYNAESLGKFLAKLTIVENIVSIVETRNGTRGLFAICQNVKR